MWKAIARAMLAAFGVAAIMATAPAARAAETCEEIVACALDTAHGQAPVSICSACGNGADALAKSIKSLLEDPSISSSCSAANGISWITSLLDSGVTEATQKLICAINTQSGTIDSQACNRNCESDCASQVGAPTLPRTPTAEDPITPEEWARFQEAVAESEKAYNGCRLKCGCGYDKLICEEGAQRLATGICDAIGLKGQKKPKLAVGESCEVDDDCGNDACGRQTAAEGAGKVCCASGDAKSYAGYDYCTQMTDGARCWSDAQCNSGLCEGNAGGTARGTCAAARKEVGAACEANKECANDACARESAEDNAPKTCCKSGSYSTYAGYDYCSNMANGTTCWSDAMCASGNCKGNMSGLKKGICR